MFVSLYCQDGFTNYVSENDTITYRAFQILYHTCTCNVSFYLLFNPISSLLNMKTSFSPSSPISPEDHTVYNPDVRITFC